MSYKKDFNLFIGGKTGILKGVLLNNENTIIKNLQSVKTLTPCNEITVMAWGDANETDILIGTRDQTVKVYDSEFKSFSSSLKAKFGTGPIVGVTRFEDVITTCSASGHIKCWKYNKEDKGKSLETKGSVEKMESSGLNSGIVATGGQANDLKLWDLTLDKQIFSAKNVKKNELDVEVPVWVTDIRFLPGSEYKIAVSSRYGQVRLYDTKAQRRPVVDLTLADQSLQCLDLAHREHQVVVASGTGHILLVDLRYAGNQNISSNQRVVSTFKGATGSVRQVACHRTQPYLASVGLDSYFRLHHIDTKQVLHQKFMQVKLNAVLMRDSLTLAETESEPTSTQESVISEPAPATEDMNYMFDTMETIGGKKRRTSQTL